MLKKLSMVIVAVLSSLAFAGRASVANDAKVDATTGLERYAPGQRATRGANLDAANQANAVNSELPDLDATRAAIDKQTGSNIQLNVSGWVSQQVQVNR